jgi:hypothetical protein
VSRQGADPVLDATPVIRVAVRRHVGSASRTDVQADAANKRITDALGAQDA